MTDDSRTDTQRDRDKISIFALGTALVRWRWGILSMAALGGALALVNGLSKPIEYVSSVTFIPQPASGTPSGLQLAASQFGFNLPQSGGSWGPQMYLEIIRSRSLLEPIVSDTIQVLEEGKKRVAFVDLLQIKAPTHERLVTAAVGALNGMISTSEDKKLGGVNVSVKARWPSVALALAKRLVQRVNEFTLETRKSQAAAERQFVEAQAAEAERTLLDAEARLQRFLQANREIGGSPALAFERDRLQREVSRRSELYTSWLQSREEARIREIRDTPVITVFESPRLPFVPQPRMLQRKFNLGATAGLLLGILLAFLADSLMAARSSPGSDAEAFFQSLRNATPRILRNRGSVSADL